MQKTAKTFFYIFGITVGGVLLFIGLSRFFPEYQRWSERCETRSKLQADVDATRQKIAEINRNIERFQDSPYFVERLARENQRVAKNEVIFILE
ncbi:MAG: hypothetical protein Q4C03_02460 [bacterium]|nr:hypothetical protein [bacterium]MDO5463010.1 hypothetical protein [bacterium]